MLFEKGETGRERRTFTFINNFSKFVPYFVSNYRKRERNEREMESIVRENYFLIDVSRAALSQTVIAQDQVVRARLRDVTVHQACVLVRGIVITLRHSSKSIFPNERLKKDSLFDSFHYVLLWHS